MLTLILIGVCVAVSLAALNNAKLLDTLILNPYRTFRGERVYSLLTSGLIHADMGHLFFNMFTLYFFGTFIEHMYGQLTESSTILYLGLFVLGIIVSDLPTLFRHRNDKNYYSLGASGGVSAVVFASILANPSNTIYVYFIPIPGFVYALLYVGYSFYMSRQGPPGINHDAHLSGALFGILFHSFVDPHAWSRLVNYF